MDSNSSDEIEILEVVNSNKLLDSNVTIKKQHEESKKEFQTYIPKYFNFKIHKDKSTIRPITYTSNNLETNKDISSKCISNRITANNKSSISLACEIGKKNYSLNKNSHDSASTTSERVFKNFISKWKKLIGSKFGSDDRKVEEKLWKYYNACSATYKNSRKFISTIEKAVDNVSEKNLYLLIKEIVDELKQNKELKNKISPGTSNKYSTNDETSSDEVKNKKDAKVEEKLKKLGEIMKKIHDKIQKLDEEEVDLDDDVNSSYLMQERLQKQLIRVNNHYCHLAKCSTKTGRPTEMKIKFDGTRFPEINKRITCALNRSKCFPDYVDILDVVKHVAEANNLPLKPEGIRILAKEVFVSIGKILKHRRLKEDISNLYTYAKEDITTSSDPARNNSGLDSKLLSNATEAKDNLNKVFQEYANKEMEKGTVVDKSDLSSEEDNSDEATKQKNNLNSESGEDDSKSTVVSIPQDSCSSKSMSLLSKNNLSSGSGDDYSKSTMVSIPQYSCSSNAMVNHSNTNSTDSFPDLFNLIHSDDKSDDYLDVKSDSDELPDENNAENTQNYFHDFNGYMKSDTFVEEHMLPNLKGQHESNKDVAGIQNNENIIEPINIDDSFEISMIKNMNKRKISNENSPLEKKRCMSPEIVLLD